MRISSLAVLLTLTAGTIGCGGSGRTSTAPSTSPTPQPEVRLAIFSDPASNFSTSDVRDVEEQIVRFDTVSNSLIWAADGRSFPGFPVSDNFIRQDRHFQVRFGSKDGERRAYFTETETGTICDINVVGNQLVISPTTVRMPGS